jgi:hypothetical protein
MFPFEGSASLIDELQTQIKNGTLFKNKSGSVSSSNNLSISSNKLSIGYSMNIDNRTDTGVNSIAAIEKAIDQRFASQVEISGNTDMPEWKRKLLEKRKLRN